LRILVAGLLTFDSGKTEFVLNLSEALSELGFKPGYFKPVAGHDGWYQHETVLYSMERKLLIGHDAYVVGERLGLLDKLHLISPLDLLTLPVDFEKLHYSATSYLDHMSSIDKRVVLGRLTLIYDSKTYRHVYYVCSDIVRKLNSEVRALLDELVSTLKTPSSLFLEISSSNLAALLENPKLYELIDSYLSYLSDHNPLIIEGYNDVAAPTKGSLNTDYVFIIAPGRALLYEGRRYRAAVEVLAYRGYPWTIKAISVIDVVGRPTASFEIPVKLYSSKLKKVFENIVEYIIHHYESSTKA